MATPTVPATTRVNIADEDIPGLHESLKYIVENSTPHAGDAKDQLARELGIR